MLVRVGGPGAWVVGGGVVEPGVGAVLEGVGDGVRDLLARQLRALTQGSHCRTVFWGEWGGIFTRLQNSMHMFFFAVLIAPGASAPPHVLYIMGDDVGW